MYAGPIWMVGLIITGTPVVARTVRGAARLVFAADLVATLAIVAAALLNQPFVGLVIVLMQTGGESLERYAHRRATAALRELERAAPRTANRVDGSDVTTVAAESLAVGETILIRPGELVPCDAQVISGASHVDASALTGEPIPLSAVAGTHLLSGSHNLDGPLTARVEAIATESQYWRIVELVRSAGESKAPLQRVADRYAIWFTPLTIAVCVIAYALSGDSMRVLAVLAVATPCPLLLATPVAILGGIDRAARRQIIVRDGGALERLEKLTVAVLDKTGTLTIGMPQVSRVTVRDGVSEGALLRLAAGIELGSGHLLARTLVAEATARGIAVPAADSMSESPGAGAFREWSMATS
jgi:P-type E1-E2 ATPase